MELGGGCLLIVAWRATGSGLKSQTQLTMIDLGVPEEVVLMEQIHGKHELVACGFGAAVSLEDKVQLLDLSRRPGKRDTLLPPIAAVNPTHLCISQSHMVFVKDRPRTGERVSSAFHVFEPCIKMTYLCDDSDGSGLRWKKIGRDSKSVVVKPAGRGSGRSCLDGARFYLMEEGGVVSMIELPSEDSDWTELSKMTVFTLDKPEENIKYIVASGAFLWVVTYSDSAAVLYRQKVGTPNSTKEKVCQLEVSDFGSTSVVIGEGLLVWQVDRKLRAYTLTTKGDVGAAARPVDGGRSFPIKKGH